MSKQQIEQAVERLYQTSPPKQFGLNETIINQYNFLNSLRKEISRSRTNVKDQEPPLYERQSKLETSLIMNNVIQED